MRMSCEVLINNRLLPSYNMKSQRSTHSSIAIGKQDSSNRGIFIHICNIQNPKGNKYKILQNIDAVFTKFIEEGKFTIRLKEPAIDLIIKCAPTKAKQFLKVLKLALTCKNIENLSLASLNPVKRKNLEKPKTKLTVISKNDYPKMKAFPSTLQELNICGLQLTGVEKQILNLKFLKFLDLSDNCLKEIPVEFGNMKFLANLNMRDNKIEKLIPRLLTEALSTSLTLLDLANNKLSTIPHQIHKLKNMDTLILSGNRIETLPESIGRLKKLRHLHVSNNHITQVPLSMQNLFLESLDLYGNRFHDDDEWKGREVILTSRVLSLKAISGAVAVRYRLNYSCPNIPATLGHYIDQHYLCTCGKILFESHIIGYVSISLKKLASTLTSEADIVPAEGKFCSQKCLRRRKRFL